MTQEQFAVSAREIEGFAKRDQHLQEKLARADIDCHRLAEDLLAANAKVDQLRNESANLRAEKKIWEVI
jgi:nucleoprotein TPR